MKWGKITPSCLKLKIWCVSTNTYGVPENTLCSTKALLISLNVDVNISLARNLHFFDKNSTFTQSNIVRAVLEIF